MAASISVLRVPKSDSAPSSRVDGRAQRWRICARTDGVSPVAPRQSCFTENSFAGRQHN